MAHPLPGFFWLFATSPANPDPNPNPYPNPNRMGRCVRLVTLARDGFGTKKEINL